MSFAVPTIKVMPWGENQGDFVEINEEDFDPEVHKLYDELGLESPAPKAKGKAAAKGWSE